MYVQNTVAVCKWQVQVNEVGNKKRKGWCYLVHFEDIRVDTEEASVLQ